MSSSRNEYMKLYMRKRRAEQPTSRRARMESALRKISDLVEGKTGPIAIQISKLAKEALG